MWPGPSSWARRILGSQHSCQHPRVRAQQSETLCSPVYESPSLRGIRSAWLRQAPTCEGGSYGAEFVWWRLRVEATNAGPN